MFLFIRRNLSCLNLKHNSPLPGSPFSSSNSVYFISNSTESHLSINPAVFDILRDKYKISPELASRVASELSRLKDPEKADSVLSFLKESGFSNVQLEKVMKYKPLTLAGNLQDSIKPKFKFFQELGFSSSDISRLISGNPGILKLSLYNNIIPSLSVLKGLYGSIDEMAKAVSHSPRFLTANLGNNVIPNFEFLKSCGIPMERIRIILIGFPQYFLVNPETMRKCVDKANEMGLSVSSRNFIYAIAAIASVNIESWEPKLQAFRDLGFSNNDILTMFGKAPTVFRTSIKKIKKIKEVLLATGKFNLSCIVNCPSSLGCSVEKRFKPRLHIVGILESKNLIKWWPSLGTICVLTDDEFSRKFISPYLMELRDVDIPNNFTKSEKEMRA